MTTGREPVLEEEPTTVVPATAAAGLGGAEGVDLSDLAAVTAEAGARHWFDDRLRGFIDALSFDAEGRARSAVERRALASAARDMIERVAIRASGEPTSGWPADAVLQPEQLLANTFFVRAIIARGGVGEIYRARHRDLRTEHAVKILLPRHTLDTTMTMMFLQEARLLASVRHAGVVACQGLLRDSDGRLLLVMDHVRGCTLSARLREGPMPVPELLVMARRLLEALGAIHAAGIVHHDLSPDNIVLADDHSASPRIVDFGVAREVAESAETALLLDFAGKYSWIAPEELGGREAPSDPRSDLYSFGLVLAAAARGRKLEMGTDAESARAARVGVPALDEVPAEVAEFVRLLLAPEPAGRPGSAGAALALLGHVEPERKGGWLARLAGA